MKISNLILTSLTLVLLIFPITSKAFVAKKINLGDTVYQILRSNHFNRKQVNLALQDDILPKSFALVPGQKYYITQESNRFNIRFYDDKGDYVYTYWRKNDQAGSKKEAAQYRTKIKTVSGKVYGSLIGSIAKHVKDKQLAYRFMDGYLYDYNLKKILQKGDKFTITYEEKYIGDTFIKTGEIINKSLEINGEIQQRHYVEFPDGGAFVSNEWNQESRPLYAPASYARFSSLFSYRRRHPVQGRVKPHLGLDYELPNEAKIFAAASGKVLRMGKNRASGNYVVIRHTNGFESYYNHLSKLQSDIRKGTYVATGQVIGYNGCTGYCTKPHLHFAVKKNGRFVDPIKYVKSYPYHRKSYIKSYLAKTDRPQASRF